MSHHAGSPLPSTRPPHLPQQGHRSYLAWTSICSTITSGHACGGQADGYTSGHACTSPLESPGALESLPKTMHPLHRPMPASLLLFLLAGGQSFNTQTHIVARHTHTPAKYTNLPALSFLPNASFTSSIASSMENKIIPSKYRSNNNNKQRRGFASDYFGRWSCLIQSPVTTPGKLDKCDCKCLGAAQLHLDSPSLLITLYICTKLSNIYAAQHMNNGRRRHLSKRHEQKSKPHAQPLYKSPSSYLAR